MNAKISKVVAEMRERFRIGSALPSYGQMQDWLDRIEAALQQPASADVERAGVLAVPRELLEGIIGDYRVCLGISQAVYEEFCRKGVGRKPNEAWGLHCRRRIDELSAALAHLQGAKP